MVCLHTDSWCGTGSYGAWDAGSRLRRGESKLMCQRVSHDLVIVDTEFGNNGMGWLPKNIRNSPSILSRSSCMPPFKRNGPEQHVTSHDLTSVCYLQVFQLAKAGRHNVMCVFA